ncbi:MAG: iron-sulfur cluster assembly scaffold protein [Nanoarchaeota archaeon]|nr:iron-sulfur cluster assembly scaffold protein [Nanoarchaeota archaeon]
METMYKEEILDLYAEKPNYGPLKNKTHSAILENPSCGDEIHLDLKVENGKIIDAKYTNKKGCFVTIVSASAITEKIKGMTLEEVKKLSKKDIDKLLGIKIIETRIACELLPLEAIKEAIK